MAERWFRSSAKETQRTKAVLLREGMHEELAARVSKSKDDAIVALCDHYIAEEKREEGGESLGKCGDEPQRMPVDEDARSDTSVETDDEEVMDACPKCGGRLAYTSKQTRSADEGMTSFVVCNACGYVRRE